VLGNVVRRSGAVLYTGSDLSVGHAVAVANDHGRQQDRSLLKVIVKVILYDLEIVGF
jgi:hypothetical protein